MGKNYVDSTKLVDKSKAYDPAEALDLVCTRYTNRICAYSVQNSFI